MEHQRKIDDSAFSPSFSCYSSSSAAALKVTREFDQQYLPQFYEFSDADEDDFEFALMLRDEQVSAEEIASSEGRIIFPIFNNDLLTKGEVERDFEALAKDDDSDDHSSASVRIPLRNLFIDEQEETSSSSSSQSDELENIPSLTYCVWRPNMDGSSPMIKCKKSNSTGSGSKKWRIRDLLRRSNSEGKEPMVLLTTPKKVETPAPKQKRTSGEVSKLTGKLKAPATSVHELFYVQKRAENESGKRKTYLPYRQDLVGFFANVNGGGKMLPF